MTLQRCQSEGDLKNYLVTNLKSSMVEIPPPPAKPVTETQKQDRVQTYHVAAKVAALAVGICILGALVFKYGYAIGAMESQTNSLDLINDLYCRSECLEEENYECLRNWARWEDGMEVSNENFRGCIEKIDWAVSIERSGMALAHAMRYCRLNLEPVEKICENATSIGSWFR